MTHVVAFDDLDTLRSLVSDEFGDWGEPITVSQEMIQGFADLTGDHQWIHVDVERARRESPFGAPIAHGFLVLSLIPTLYRSAGLAITGHTNAVNYGAESLRFVSPVPAGSTVAARSRVVGVERRSGGTLLTREIEVRVVGAEKPAVLYRMQVLYR